MNLKKNGFSLAILLIILALAAAGGYVIYNTYNLKDKIGPIKPTLAPKNILPTASPTISPSPAQNLTANWKTYKNTQYGFEISYPEGYQVLTDKDSLYGWPKAVALLYQGGQSYDLAIEVWDSEAEYKAKYTDSSTFSVFKTENGKFFTLLNANKVPEVTTIISTFEFTN